MNWSVILVALFFSLFPEKWLWNGIYVFGFIIIIIIIIYVYYHGEQKVLWGSSS